jgi:hypothetical protein
MSKPITIKEVIVGCGEDWYHQDVIYRQNWLIEHVGKESYTAWYGNLKSDDHYIKFDNEEDALAYKIRWMTN